MLRILLVFIVASVCYFISVLAMSEEMEQVIKQLHETCQGRTEVPEEMIQNCRKGEFADDQKLKCYLACVMIEMASMDEDDGEIDVESTIAILPEEFQDSGIPDTIRKCGTQAGADNCETAWLTHKCYYNDNPKDYFVV